MVSASETLQPDRRLTTLALLVALGVVLHRLEALLPLPSPWVKLGLANVMTLVALVFFGFRDALTVTVLRVVLGSILGGTFLGPTFFLSLAGGIAATGVMAWVYGRWGKDPLSLIGVSVCAAYAHTLAVVFCVYLFWIRQDVFLTLLPVFFTFALVTGILT
ncbi:MAG: Gx transporter family protein, partial [Nitrospinae bacterium]|nr:Gx transporter family protein [Nitrospinota bacterium]